MMKSEKLYGKVTVVNKYKHSTTDMDIYVGRGSVLGNIYSHLDSKHNIIKVNTRDIAVDQYSTYFYNIMSSCGCKHKEFKNTVRQLVLDVRLGRDLNLVCYCSPKKCHGDVIKQYIEEHLDS